ncbi:MAG: (2Fe-2S)-binding protein [Kofleriaceae bacterium]|nr:(2Fe-2S)-binding protein [Kofleriaceae bacterium]
MPAHATDSYAAAAWLAGQRVLSRSLKYHRPRGAFCLEGHCSGCLVRIDGVPNLRACQASCRDGASLESQNAFPSAEFDVLGAVDQVYRRGMNHHTLMTSATVLNNVANRVVRALSGLGKLPTVSTAHNETETGQPVVHVEIDVAIVGGGPSGLAAAAHLAASGRSVLLLDEQLELGGSYLADVRFGRRAAATAIAAAQDAGASMLAQTTVIGYFAEPGNIRQGVMIACHGAGHGRWHEATLLRIHAKRWLWATGGYASNLPFNNNDRPGVIAARAAARLLTAHDIVAGERIVMIVDGARGGAAASEARRHAAALTEALTTHGAAVRSVALADVAAASTALIGNEVTSIELHSGECIECDTVAVVALPSPASEGPRMQGCAVTLDPDVGGYAVAIDRHGRTSVRGAYATGDVTGFVGPAAAALHGAAIAAVIIADLAAGEHAREPHVE